MLLSQLIAALVGLLLDALGDDEWKARDLISEEAKRRANAAADAVANARKAAGV